MKGPPVPWLGLSAFMSRQEDVGDDFDLRNEWNVMHFELNPKMIFNTFSVFLLPALPSCCRAEHLSLFTPASNPLLPFHWPVISPCSTLYHSFGSPVVLVPPPHSTVRLLDVPSPPCHST